MSGGSITRKATSSRVKRVLIGELDDDVKLPRSSGCCVWAAARVVVLQSRVYIGCQADIELRTLICISENVDEALVSSHGPTPVAIGAPG